jgi:DNA polymerase III alpha subunit (gram-positive type)
VESILIVDSETGGLEPGVDELLEFGYVLWSVRSRTAIESFSALLPRTLPNGAVAINGIPEDAPWCDPEIAWAVVGMAAARADCIVAHHADFDRRFVVAEVNKICSRNLALPPSWVRALDKTWVCSLDDFPWPEPLAKRDLVSVALSYGVGVVAAHRAANDCWTLARIFERIEDVDVRLEWAKWRAEQPKIEVISRLPYDERHIVKAEGRFHYRSESRTWHAHLLEQEIAARPFEVVRASELSNVSAKVVEL